jgi:acyl dehydratase
MNYDEVAEGETVGVREIDEVRPEEMQLMAAILGDSNPIHFDERLVEEMDHPGLVNQGPINASYAVQAVLEVLESPTDLRSFELRFESNVNAGDAVRATATVEEKRVVDGEGVVEFALALEREDGTSVLSGSATARLPRA